MQTREQRYASGVYEFMLRCNARGDRYKQAYGSMAHTLPMLIHKAGLVQALSFVASRPSDKNDAAQAPQDLLGDLALVLGYADHKALCDASRRLTINEYMRLTQEALQALLWFKRYAQSVLNVDSPTDTNAEGGVS